MNGAHDLGGMLGFGKVVAEANEPVFHALWEARVFSLVMATGQHDGWNLDQDRSACENRPPAEYLKFSYYEIWLSGFSKLLGETGLLADSAKPDAAHVLRPAQVWDMVHQRGGYVRPAAAAQKFESGDGVRTRNIHPDGHTRLPRYLRGHPGEIVAVHGAHVFPDSNAQGTGEDPQWLYTVRFKASDVWGIQSRDSIHADLWEPYLEPL